MCTCLHLSHNVAVSLICTRSVAPLQRGIGKTDSLTPLCARAWHFWLLVMARQTSSVQSQLSPVRTRPGWPSEPYSVGTLSPPSCNPTSDSSTSFRRCAHRLKKSTHPSTVLTLLVKSTVGLPCVACLRSLTHTGKAANPHSARFFFLTPAGAGIFVTTVVAGSVALVKPFTVASRPFLRDVSFYMVAVFWTFLMLFRQTTTLGETLGILSLFYSITHTHTPGTNTVHKVNKNNENRRKQYCITVVRPSLSLLSLFQGIWVSMWCTSSSLSSAHSFTNGRNVWCTPTLSTLQAQVTATNTHRRPIKRRKAFLEVNLFCVCRVSLSGLLGRWRSLLVWWDRSTRIW